MLANELYIIGHGNHLVGLNTKDVSGFMAIKRVFFNFSVFMLAKRKTV